MRARSIAVVLAVWGLGAGGCADDRDARVGTAAPRSGDLEAGRRGRVVGGLAVARTLGWPAQIDEQRAARIDPAVRASIERAPVPVLVPGPPWLSDLSLVAGDTWIAVSARRAELSLVLQGSAQARVHEGIRAAAPTHRVRGQPGFVSANEGIVVASWIEYGAAYSLELECADTRAPECRDAAFLLAQAHALAYVGGSGAAR